jgi:hypothetical protein
MHARMIVLGLGLVAWATEAVAQTTAEVAPSSGKELLAILINTLGVGLTVQLVKQFRPMWADKYGWLLPIIAVAAGPVILFAQSYLAAKLGYDIDLSVLVGALTGTAAVAAHQVYIQKKEGPQGTV